MISIDFKSRKPIYEQLVDGIKRLVICGALGQDEQLPSVRQMSGDLGVNPNTVQRAFTALELQGVIYTMPGKGNFVAAKQSALIEEQKRASMEKLTVNVRELKELGTPLEQINGRVRQIYGECAEK